MRALSDSVLCGGLAGLLLLACGGDSTIRCRDASDCLQGNIPGTCEPSPASADHFCAFPDTTCPGSMARWGVASGDGLAGECVAGTAVDAGGADAPPGDAATCVPDTTRCESGQLLRCDSAGHPLAPEACVHACVAELSAAGSHCAGLQARFVGTACDEPTSEPDPAITQSVRLDTGTIACNGGVLTQPPNSPDLCVLRYTRFSVAPGATLSAVGSRAIAIVSDGDIDIEGNLDLAARGRASGAGGGSTISGASASGASDVFGSGGAGFSQPGAPGGGASDGSGASGGAMTHPELDGVVAGGPRGGGGMVAGGGGGGGITLISCKGTVRVTGAIGAGGGGGAGGLPQGQFEGFGGGGGGAGGEVVLQGVRVAVHGQIFVNGGAGGGGTSGPGGGAAGEDGSLSATTAAAGGPPVGSGGAGGAGGSRGTSPQPGRHGGTAGGGGGSAGSLQIYLPQGVTPDLTGAILSPAPQPTSIVPTH